MLARFLGQFLRNDDGATAMEYALLAALIGIALVGSFAVIGGSVGNMFGAAGASDVIATSAQKIN